MLDIITDNLDVWTMAQKNKKAVGRGSSNKKEAYGIKKLRELILELAVRGKLVPQDISDEPAGVLLKTILDKHAKLIKEKNIRKPKKVPELNAKDIKFKLPEGWVYVRNGNLFSLRKGKKPKNISENEIGLPYLDIEALDRGNILRFTEDDKCPQSTAEDILVVCDGSRSGLVLDGKKGVVGSTMAVIDTPKMIQPFIKLFFMQAFQRLNSSMKGAAIPHLDTKNLILEIIGLPPLAEQNRIVAKVDELMALCDQLEQQQNDQSATHQTLVETLLNGLIESAETSPNDHQSTADFFNQLIAKHFDTLFTTEQSIDQLKQTILQLAVMGKLVPQDPTDEPASVLLEKIRLIEAGKIKKQKVLPEIGEDEKPFELPKSWEWVSLDNIVSVMDSGWSPACIPTPSPNDDVWGVLKTTAVQVMKYLDNENKELPLKLEPKPQYEVKVNDILITRAGPKNRVGISCLVETTRPKLMISDKIIRFHLVDAGIYEHFISLCLNAGATSEYLENSKSGMAESQMNISQVKLKLAPIPLCPTNEQHRIVKKVNQLLTLCDSLEANLNQAQTTQTQLADAIVKQAVN